MAYSYMKLNEDTTVMLLAVTLKTRVLVYKWLCGPAALHCEVFIWHKWMDFWPKFVYKLIPLMLFSCDCRATVD